MNTARFGDPFEFGHNYLPEFVRAEEGQFSFEYLQKNWAELFRWPKVDASSGRVQFFTYGGQMAFAINPILLLAVLTLVIDGVKRRMRLDAGKMLLLSGVAAHLLIVLCHRTLGGWQFGNRYIVDILPYVFCGMLDSMPGGKWFSRLGRIACCEGIALNLVGMIATYNHWM